MDLSADQGAVRRRGHCTLADTGNMHVYIHDITTIVLYVHNNIIGAAPAGGPYCSGDGGVQGHVGHTDCTAMCCQGK